MENREVLERQEQLLNEIDLLSDKRTGSGGSSIVLKVVLIDGKKRIVMKITKNTRR